MRGGEVCLQNVAAEGRTSRICRQICFPLRLRNDVAHGLADEALCNSVLALYAWWLILQLVVETFASTLEGMAETEDQ